MKKLAVVAATFVGLAAAFAAKNASANPTKLDLVWGGSNGTVVFIHGHGNCVGTSGSDSRCSGDPKGYWLNSADDGGDGHDFLNESTAKCTSGNAGSCTAWAWTEAITIRYDGVNQGFWGAANDVAGCLQDLVNGSNSSGCNPSLLRRTSFKVVAHSEGGTIIDRILSSGWWPSITSAIQKVVTSSGALAGAKSASALYGVDGASNFCTTFVSFLAGWALKDTGNASLTRGTVIGEANNYHQGKSGLNVYKITTTGGSGSCNNNWYDGISEAVNDSKMGALSGCVGYSSDDDTDGVLWMYDNDPTANPSNYWGGKSRSQFTGNYYHWVASWSNHSHNRNDAYVHEYGYQGTNGCYTISPGTCIGQYF
jgi:hypothetical protein